jgi:uncharacterized RDD family membrane protein YckC
MNQAAINWTNTEKVSEDTAYAKFSSRLGAFVIDALIGVPIGFGIYLAIGSSFVDERQVGALIAFPIFALKAWRQSTHGHSIGQSVLGIGIAGTETKNSFSAIVRNFLSFGLMAIPFLNALNVLVILFSKDKRGLHDRVAKTWVIATKK